jgi:hypothetical protein
MATRYLSLSFFALLYGFLSIKVIVIGYFLPTFLTDFNFDFFIFTILLDNGNSYVGTVAFPVAQFEFVYITHNHTSSAGL